jgi:hypothetical protein
MRHAGFTRHAAPPRRRTASALLAAAMLWTVVPSAAQNTTPEIAFDSATPLMLPADVYLGEVAGVAANSKGDVFVYTRTGHPTISLGSSRAFAHGGSRLFQFDRTGRFVREIGRDSYAFMFAQQVRIDPQDNIWVVDQMSNSVLKLDPNGRMLMLLGRKPEAIPVPAPTPRGGEGGAAQASGGAQSDVFNRPTDVTWDAAGNIFVADGLGNARIAKFTSKGVFIKSWGSRGTGPGLFGSVLAIAVDAQGNVYAADGPNKRIQVFDNNGTFKTQFTNVGTPAAICMTPGPNQLLFSSNSNPPEDFDSGGEIYELKLDGTVVGKFGRAGKPLKEFGAVNSLDCRSANTLLVGEVANMRVQRITLRASQR